MSEKLKDLTGQPWRSLAGWFLGPKAENREVFNKFVLKVLNWYEDCRAKYQPTDPLYITDQVRISEAYREGIDELEAELSKLTERLGQSVPFFSPRYKGHMIWDVTLPSLLGYIAGMLWNQNNVDSSTSPVTTEFEITVGKQLCEMLGFMKNNDITPWGHITSCGSVSNIEALWAARNLKFHPIAMKNAVCTDPRLHLAKENFSVYIPRLEQEVRLIDVESWDLLNLDIDGVCSMSEKVAKACGITMKALSEILDSFTCVSLGLHEFMKSNGLRSNPAFFTPATNHYSWPKAATLLGIGSTSLVPVPVDVNCRQDISELEKKLNNCLDSKIPVITIVAIVGSTGESAVDPVEEILRLREKFRKKGLNFCIHVDAAWGGYLASMLREPIREKNQIQEKSNVNYDIANYDLQPFFPRRGRTIHEIDFKTIHSHAHQMSKVKGHSPRPIRKLPEESHDFVPAVSLSPYVQDQYEALKNVDSITIDPHKAGFCVYPSGALCYRNMRMRDFIALVAPEVSHGDDDQSVGVYGLEGSKPGAAASSVLLSHNVINLDKSGYGRILGQCTYGTKLFYAMWMTVARENDPFVCLNIIDSEPSGVSDSKKFIRERILGRTNKEVFRDKEAMQFLSEIGPDTLINAFAVNLKNEDGTKNDNVKLMNDLQSAIFDELSGHVGMTTKRTPMFLTMSTLDAKRYGNALEQFKTRLGIEEERGVKEDLNFLRNTVMNPFQSSEGFIEKIGEIFRNTVLNCIGKLKDKPSKHSFVLGHVSKHGRAFCAYIPSFSHPGHQYDVIIRIQISETAQINEIRALKNKKTLIIATVDEMTMFDVVRSKETLEFDVFFGTNDKDDVINGPTLRNIRACVKEAIRYHHLEPENSDVDYPLLLKYFMFGDKHDVYLCHCVTKKLDFFQLLHLDEAPHDIPAELLDLGVEVAILGLQGRPQFVNDAIEDPLKSDAYGIQFRGTNDVLTRTRIKLHKQSCKIWFQEVP